MHFASLSLPLMAMLASVHGQSVTVYSDAQCTQQIQVINFSSEDYFQCIGFEVAAQGVVFSTTGFTDKGFNVWDSQYCAGLNAAGLPQYLGQCLSAATYGLFSWQSAHISPRNDAPPPTSS